MAKPRDLIVAAALIDTLIFRDERAEVDVPGGAGLYALAGAALFSDGAVLVTGTGEDYTESFGPWLRRNGLAIDGLRLAAAKTPRNLLRYLDERTRTETPIFGAAHFASIEPLADDIARLRDGARSAYIFRNADKTFWDGVIALHDARPFTILWEIGLDACSPSERPQVEAVLAHVEAVSLNVEEAGLLFDTRSEASLLNYLAAWPVRAVFLRAGRRGSYVVADGHARFIPSLEIEPVDVTGGGNAYSGAAVVGLAQGRSAVEAGMMGTVAASIAIGQVGLPEPGDRATRLRAQALLGTLSGHSNQETMR